MVNAILSHHRTAAWVYFACVLGLVCSESLLRFMVHVHFTKPSSSPSSRTRHWSVTVLVHKAASASSDLPFLGTWRTTDVTRFLIFAAFNVLFGVANNESLLDYTRYGWLAIANGGLALLMPTRNNLLGFVLRLPSASRLQYHRYLGIATVAHATTHFSYLMNSLISKKMIATAFSKIHDQVGMAAWLSLAIMFITALPVVRRRSFEVFYYAHALFVAFVIAAMVHTKSSFEFLLPGVCLYVLDRLVRGAHDYRDLGVRSVKHYDGGMTKISFTVPWGSSVQPGQIAWFQIPQVSALNWHPFTVMGSPTDPDLHAIAVRGLGGYTKKVQYVNECGIEDELSDGTLNDTCSPSLKLRMNGPYPTNGLDVAAAPVTILVAGGIGITHAMSIASYMVRTRPTSLPKDASELADGSATRQLYLIWVVKDYEHIAWFRDELEQLQELTSHEPRSLGLEVVVHVTAREKRLSIDQEDKSRDLSVISGRPDLVSCFEQTRRKHMGCDVFVNVCGPGGLVRQTRKAAMGASTTNGLFHVTEEVFEF